MIHVLHNWQLPVIKVLSIALSRLFIGLWLIHRKLICGHCLRICSLQWRRNDRGCVSNHRRLHCLLNCLFRRRSKKTSKLRVTGLCDGEFPAQKARNAENVSIWWRNYVENWSSAVIGIRGFLYFPGSKPYIRCFLTDYDYKPWTCSDHFYKCSVSMSRRQHSYHIKRQDCN